MYYLICAYDLFLSVGLQNENLLWGWKVKCTVQNQGPECEFLTPTYKNCAWQHTFDLCAQGDRQITGICWLANQWAAGSVRYPGSKNKVENEGDNRHWLWPLYILIHLHSRAPTHLPRRYFPLDSATICLIQMFWFVFFYIILSLFSLQKSNVSIIVYQLSVHLAQP